MLGFKQKAQIQSQWHYFQKPSHFWIKLCGCKFFRTRAVICLLGLYSQMLRNYNKKQNMRLSRLIYITWTPLALPKFLTCMATKSAGESSSETAVILESITVSGNSPTATLDRASGSIFLHILKPSIILW